jgi:GTP-binding protein
MKPIIAIVGRPNVGKSTLFNRIAGKKKAIIDDLPGVTRDRNYIDAEWDGKEFIMVDTGGFDPGISEDLAHLVQEQAKVAIEEADIVVFLMDANEGLLHGDIELTRILKKTMKPVFYVINKVDSEAMEHNIGDFFRIGVDNLFTISAKHKLGTTELANEIVRHLPILPAEKYPDQEIVVSIIGRPNVGKSSLINKIFGSQRLVVSEAPGTTRDSIDTVLKYKGKTIRLIDTAGIRRRSRIRLQLEKYSIMSALKSISRSSICLLMVDAVEGLSDQDAKLAAEISERLRACIVIINKWDLVAKDAGTYDRYMRQVYSRLQFLDFAQVLCVSALTGQRVRKILDLIIEAGNYYHYQISTSAFNKILKELKAESPLLRKSKGGLKIYYGTQVSTGPPSFILFTQSPDDIPANYRRFIERAIQEKLKLRGTPVALQFKEKPKKNKR